MQSLLIPTEKTAFLILCNKMQVDFIGGILLRALFTNWTKLDSFFFTYRLIPLMLKLNDMTQLVWPDLKIEHASRTCQGRLKQSASWLVAQVIAKLNLQIAFISLFAVLCVFSATFWSKPQNNRKSAKSLSLRSNWFQKIFNFLWAFHNRRSKKTWRAKSFLFETIWSSKNNIDLLQPRFQFSLWLLFC